LTSSALQGVPLLITGEDSSDLAIGETAERTGVSAHTLRYYERAGLIDPIRRGVHGERRYARRDVEWIAFLQRLRATAMPIREMAEFAQLRRGGSATVRARRELLEKHRSRVRSEISELLGHQRAIEEKLARLETGIDSMEVEESDAAVRS
jgi:DNA-binding transcriptional MerR regulator